MKYYVVYLTDGELNSPLGMARNERYAQAMIHKYYQINGGYAAYMGKFEWA